MRRLATLALLLAAAGCGDDRTERRTRLPGPAALATPRAAHTATRLPDGRVLIAGGCVTDGCGKATDTTEIYDHGRFTPGPRLTTRRDGHTATALPDGRVLVAGGYAANHDAVAEAEILTDRRATPAGRLRTRAASTPRSASTTAA